jgi:hypothetical protein
MIFQGPNQKTTLSSSTFSLGRIEAPHAQELAPGASNPRGYGQLGAWMRCKTERGDREDRDDVLTRVGDEWERPDFGEGRRPAILCLHAVAVLQGPARDCKRRRTCDSSRRSSWRWQLAPAASSSGESSSDRRSSSAVWLGRRTVVLVRGGSARGSREQGAWGLALPFIGARIPRNPGRARLGDRRRHAVMAVEAMASSLARWASRGPVAGPRGCRSERVGPSGSAQTERIGFVFSEFIFNAKTIP